MNTITGTEQNVKESLLQQKLNELQEVINILGEESQCLEARLSGVIAPNDPPRDVDPMLDHEIPLIAQLQEKIDSLKYIGVKFRSIRDRLIL